MNIQDVLVLEWGFSPADYFETPVTISRSDYHIAIQDGKIEVRMEPAAYDRNPAIKDVIEDALNDRFRGVELLTHRGYTLSFAGRSRIYPDGHRVFFENLHETIVFRASADILVADKDGKVIHDSRQERIDKKTELADLAERHGTRDALARSLLSSYHAAVTDPNDELVYLYEIRDALAKRFSGGKQACSVLGLNGIRWKRLGRLADNEPVKQGRHRGKFPGGLRDATEPELKEAREIAQGLILAYLRHLDKRAT